jgi:hypothetical protein
MTKASPNNATDTTATAPGEPKILVHAKAKSTKAPTKSKITVKAPSTKPKVTPSTAGKASVSKPAAANSKLGKRAVETALKTGLPSVQKQHLEPKLEATPPGTKNKPVATKLFTTLTPNFKKETVSSKLKAAPLSSKKQNVSSKPTTPARPTSSSATTPHPEIIKDSVLAGIGKKRAPKDLGSTYRQHLKAYDTYVAFFFAMERAHTAYKKGRATDPADTAIMKTQEGGFSSGRLYKVAIEELKANDVHETRIEHLDMLFGEEQWMLSELGALSNSYGGEE